MKFSSNRKDPARNRGFTLIEIILVVLIIALVTALAIPSFVNAIKGQRLDSAAVDLSVACQEARFEALFGSRTAWYVVDFERQEVRVVQLPPADSNAVFLIEDIAEETNHLDSAEAEIKSTFKMPSGVTLQSVQLQDGTEQVSGYIGLPFYNNGVCEPFRVFLQNEVEEVRAIEVDMFTGKAKVITPL